MIRFETWHSLGRISGRAGHAADPNTKRPRDAIVFEKNPELAGRAGEFYPGEPILFASDPDGYFAGAGRSAGLIKRVRV